VAESGIEVKKETAMIWRNRIVKSGEVDPESIPDHPHNWRMHPAKQVAAIEGVLADVGIVDRCLVNLRTSEEFGEAQGVPVLLDGHLRKERAIATGQPTVLVDYVDLDPREESIVLATLDPISGQAQTNADELDAVLLWMRTDYQAVQDLVADVATEADLGLSWSDAGFAVTDPVSVPPPLPEGTDVEKVATTINLVCGDIREPIPMSLYVSLLNAFLASGDIVQVLLNGVQHWSEGDGDEMDGDEADW